MKNVVTALIHPEASPQTVQGTSDFLIRCVEEAADTRDSHILFQCLLDEPTLVRNLVSGLRTADVRRKESVVDILHTFCLRATKPASVMMPLGDPFAGKYLLETNEKFKSMLTHHLEGLILALNGSWGVIHLNEKSEK